MVRWPHFTPLIRTLTMFHFQPGTVTMSGGLPSNITHTHEPPRTVAPPTKKQPQAQRGGNTSTRSLQVAVQNPSPLPHLQVGPGFCLRHSMEQAEDITGAPVLQIDDGHQLCLNYHLKGMCNLKCGICHMHMTLSSHNQGVLGAWKSHFCAAHLPVSNI